MRKRERTEEGKMLTCITCTKQLNSKNGSIGRQQQDEDTLETPRTRQAIKVLTSQVLLLVMFRNLLRGFCVCLMRKCGKKTD